jgi:hypothetical protein
VFALAIFPFISGNIINNDWYIITNTSIFLSIVLIDLFCKNRYCHFYEVASKFRTLDLLTKSLAYEISPVEESYLNSAIEDKIFKKLKLEDGNSYFLSKQDVGSHKLVDNIQENSFWTSNVMSIFVKYISSVKYILIVILVIVLTLIIVFHDSIHSINDIISKIIILFTQLLLATDIHTYLSSYKKCSLQLKNLDEKIEKEKNNLNLEKSLLFSNEYNEIISKSYPVPEFLYKKNNRRLNLIWKDRVKREYINQICVLSQRMKSISQKWVITGSSRLLFDYADIVPSDIDILTTEKGAYDIENLFKEYMIENVNYKETDKMKSHFGLFRINNIKIEIIGDIQNEIDGKYQPHPDWENKIIQQLINGVNIPVFTLEYELEINRLLRKCDKVLLIEELFKNKKS